MTWTTRIIQILLAAAFVMFGILKLSTHELQMEVFTSTYGYSVGFMYIVGAVELVAGIGLIIGLWHPRITLLSAGVIAMIMASAMLTHIRSHDGMRSSVPLLIFLAMAIFLVIRSSRGQERARA
ncbi:DoxX family membrane protein [Paenibacillus sp. LMG 31461]|uniref:DoxX family membrane protein n=1 Tax=Paenibacillus plantarum TaxID=2654975 RepID=A0ABX1XKS2_9BACL|nr:DoxX family protein [Paenibacillus plantarum]NOU69041.1 DoxX family membrane protein [Paenibacillus plantarum]